MRRHSNMALERRTPSNNAPGTHYDVTTAESACGDFPAPSDFVVAMNSPDFQGGKVCHQMITIQYQGKKTAAKIVDECPTCWPNGVDFSNGLFEFFAPLPTGLIYMDWYFGTDAPPPPPPKPSPTTTSKHTTSTTHTSTHASSSSTHSLSSVHPSSSSSSAAGAKATTQSEIQANGNLQNLMQMYMAMGELVVVGAKNATA